MEAGIPRSPLRGFALTPLTVAGRLVEIQSGPLGPLRGKLRRLLPEHRIRIVKPVALRRRIVRRSKRDGPDLSARCSPKRGALLDVFDDLMGIVSIFPHSNLEIEILAVTIDEVRVPRRRWPGYSIADRILGTIHGTTRLKRTSDLWKLLTRHSDSSCANFQRRANSPNSSDAASPFRNQISRFTGRDPFTTLELAQAIERPIWFAQRVAYCLRLSGAVRVVGKLGNRRIYVRNA